MGKPRKVLATGADSQATIQREAMGLILILSSLEMININMFSNQRKRWAYSDNKWNICLV